MKYHVEKNMQTPWLKLISSKIAPIVAVLSIIEHKIKVNLRK